ncbi:tripartite tricarboxylate transporter TctB family protein [Rothia aerolata]|uniref:DUF1468 domain-containing protein n=1 Tax=Rothia aerolata TaxID=1812262 RepID=A0A917IX67_9MICC|nr:tripartite tricarboxylate transporter TctB family protein [Rothia aerolata]GGH66300.1 hypothetical protein GCM10007359_20380 [Rothia aerolata]
MNKEEAPYIAPDTQASPIVGRHQPENLRGGYPRIYIFMMSMTLIVFIALAVYAFNLAVGSFSKPGPGLWILTASVLALLAWPFALKAKEEYERFNRERVDKMLFMLAGLVAFVVLYPFTGFLVAGFISMLIITRFSARESWKVSLILSVLTPVVVYLVFVVAFQVGLSGLPEWMS